MKKIVLSLLFIAFSFSTNAQNIVDREVIKDSPNAISPFVDEDISLLATNFNAISDLQLKQLQRLVYHKYVALSSEMIGEELQTYIDGVKTEMEEILGASLYLQVSQNEVLFDRISGEAYLDTPPVSE